MKMRAGTALALVTVFVLVFSCGDSNTGPSSPDVNPSTLSLVFTGDSSKVGNDNNRNTSPSYSSFNHRFPENGTDSKGSCEVTASWTICTDAAFKNYILYRSETPAISSDFSSATVLGIFADVNTSEYIDTDTDWATIYYYALKTTDTNDNSVWSNEDSISTPGTAPSPSVLSAGTVGFGFVDLHWSQCPDDDFDSYWLYRSETPNIQNDTSFAQRLCTISSAWDTTYTDNDVIPEFTYYYALMTTNNKEFSSWSNEISIDTPETIPDSVVATVNVGDRPVGICSLPSGEYVYVTNKDDDTVSIIRTSDNTVVETVNVDYEPYGICSLPSGEYVYVGNSVGETVSVIRTSDNTVVETVNTFDRVYGICSLPSGEYVYVTSNYNSEISVIRTSDNTLVETVSVGSNPYGICSLPSGEYVYVTCDYDAIVSIIRTSDNTVVKTVNVGDYPLGICSLPSGEYVYVANSSDDTVSIIRTSDNTVVETVDVGSSPYGICSLPSGKYVYVTSSYDATVSIIRTSDNTVVETVYVGSYPSYGICALPSGEYVYVTNNYYDTVSVIH